jgi:hypothetical protein
MGGEDLQAKKELLIAQAEFDRIAFALALHDVRRVVRPSGEAFRRTHSHSAAAKFLDFAAPFLGTERLSRAVRALSIALTIYRFMRGR